MQSEESLSKEFELSVVIPIYVEEERQHKAIIERIKSYDILAKIYGDTEIIVVDDGSTPAFGEELMNLPLEHVKKFHLPRAGDWTQPRAKNIGAQAATGNKILFIDIDHLTPPMTFAAILQMPVRPNEAVRFARRGLHSQQMLPSAQGIVLVKNTGKQFHEQFCGHYGHEDKYFYIYHDLNIIESNHIIIVSEDLGTRGLTRDTTRNQELLAKLMKDREEPEVTKLEDIFNGYSSIMHN